MCSDLVLSDQTHAFTTSLLVAEKFGKQHKDVLKAIRKLEPNKTNLDWLDEFHGRNFALMFTEVSIGNNAKRRSPYYEIQRDGFSILAMGFTGTEALQWKIQFINAFNQMEALLTELKTQEHHALFTEHQTMLNALFSIRPQWRETIDLTRYGFKTAEIAKLQNKHPDSVRQMKQRIRKAGIDLNPMTEKLGLIEGEPS